MYSVSVVIPIYNVEKHIAKCAISLFEQTLQSIQYIFVNDCSKDNSMDILMSIINKYPERRKDITIINHSTNCGLATARNTGRNLATGEYIIDCDSDDWIDLDTYEILYKTAKKNNADIVICGMYYEFADKIICKVPNNYRNIKEAFKDSLNGGLHNSCCNKLVKNELYKKNNIKCIDGVNMLEDTLVMTKLLYHANTIEIIPRCLYHYSQTNNTSYTHYWRKKNFDDIILVTDSILKYFNKYNKYNITEELNYLSLNSKLMLLMNSDNIMRKNYYCLYNDSKKYIWKHPNIIFRYKLILYFSSKRWYFISNFLINITYTIKKWVLRFHN